MGFFTEKDTISAQTTETVLFESTAVGPTILTNEGQLGEDVNYERLLYCIIRNNKVCFGSSLANVSPGTPYARGNQPKSQSPVHLRVNSIRI